MAFKSKTTHALALVLHAWAQAFRQPTRSVGLMLPTPAPMLRWHRATNGFKQYVAENGGKPGGREVEYAVDDESNPAKATETPES